MQVHADHLKAGVLYGYRTKGDYGEYSEGQGNVYYFGRTRQKDVLDFKCTSIAWTQEDKDVTRELLRKKCNRTGLNAPSRVMLWARVHDVDQAWEDVRMKLRGQPPPTSMSRSPADAPKRARVVASALKPRNTRKYRNDWSRWSNKAW